MQDGWIKLWRKSTDSEVFQNPELWLFWCWCLLKASRKNRKQVVGWQTIELKPGQFVFGRKKAAQELPLSEQKIRTCLKKLKTLQKLTIKSTNKFSLITIEKWDTYQDHYNRNNQLTNQQLTNNQPTTNQQLTTNKNVKNEKNVKKYSYGDPQKWNRNQPIDHVSFVDAFNELYDRQLRVTDSKRENIRSRLRTFTGEEIKKAWQNRTKDQWLNSEGSKYLGDWKAAMRNDEKIDKYLNIQENHKSNGQPGNGKENRAERFFRIGKELFEDAPA